MLVGLCTGCAVAETDLPITRAVWLIYLKWVGMYVITQLSPDIRQAASHTPFIIRQLNYVVEQFLVVANACFCSAHFWLFATHSQDWGTQAMGKRNDRSSITTICCNFSLARQLQNYVWKAGGKKYTRCANGILWACLSVPYSRLTAMSQWCCTCIQRNEHHLIYSSLCLYVSGQ